MRRSDVVIGGRLGVWGSCLGVLVGLCEERIDCALRGDESFRALTVDVVVVFRIVAGVRIVLLRIEVGFGRFGDRTPKDSGFSMSL
jgi:hypothetical protein